MPRNTGFKRPRVTLVIHNFDRGGSGRVAAYLAQGFAELGMKVELLVFARGGEVEGVAETLAGDKVSIHYIGRSCGVRPLDFVRGLPSLIRRLRQDKPDFVIACANNAALPTAIGYRLAGLRDGLFLKTTNPIVSSRHRGLIRRIRLLTYRRIFPWAASVWTLSEEESVEMLQAFPQFSGLFRAVANPYVTPAMFATSRNDEVRSPGKTVICVARLTKQKRLERLIAAFGELPDPQIRLLILGEGEERAALARQIGSLGLASRISMPGYVDDVAAALHAADLFVLPSDYEGLPAVVLEAMAANCPVLGTDCFPAARALLGTTPGCAIIEDVAPKSLAAQIAAHLAQPRPSHLRAIAERYSIANGVDSHAQALAGTERLR